ncbi:unnamed protein product, partial [Mesorhabditis spiculigera]
MVKVVILVAGKRKSGKDFVSGRIQDILSRQCGVEMGSVSQGLKKEYARLHGLNYEELLTDGPYKEEYRKDMIRWGEEQRAKDPHIFCRETLRTESSAADVLIITDCRRETDMQFYKSLPDTLAITVRISCSTIERVKRGFEYNSVIDDSQSECGLDNYPFDFYIDNSGDADLLAGSLEQLTVRVFAAL